MPAGMRLAWANVSISIAAVDAVAEPDLAKALDIQVGYLQRSARDFDDGELDEAHRLAVTVRVLCHDTRQSTSLLTQLGWKDSMGFMDSSHPAEPPTMEIEGRVVQAVGWVHHGLGRLRMGGGGPARIVPYFDDVPLRNQREPVPFDHWWTNTILTDGREQPWTRKELVLAMANKDGGAHVDQTLPDDYYHLTRDNAMRIRANTNPDIGNEVALANMRQVAHELMRSIETQTRYAKGT